MVTDLNWHAVYTKPRWEKKVAALLTEKNIVNYCPLNKVRHQWCDRKKIVWEPLFTSYVFVRVAASNLLSVRQTDGVLNFVHWRSKPAVIKDEEIELIRQFLIRHEQVGVEVVPINSLLNAGTSSASQQHAAHAPQTIK